MDCCQTKNHNHGMDHGSAGVYLRRFWIVTFLLIPLVLPVLGVVELNKYLQFGIATIIFLFSLVFFQHAWHEIKSKKYGMMTLVSLAVASGYLFSVFSTFVNALEAQFYLEISTLIWVLLFGHYLEAKSSSAAGNALDEVAKLLPKKAHLLEEGGEKDVDVTDLKEKDLVIVKPGEKVPADGKIVSGSANVDESLISGESKPIQKKEDDEVVAGSVCLDGSLKIQLSKVGENSTVGQIQKLIQKAGETKPRSQRIADRASGILTFVAGITALVTLLVWMFLLGKPFVFAITLAITVLVIACPHALGLAIPTVTTITTSLAVKNGFFIKDLSKIEMIRKADYVVFDKTGTLTEGRFGVSEVVGDRTLEIAASLEQNSSHIIAKAILNEAKDLELLEVSDFENISGKGIRGKVNGKEYLVGNGKLVGKSEEEVSGTVVYVSEEGNVLGHIVLKDEIKESSKEAIEALHNMGIKVAMLTGDNKGVAKSVSEDLGIDIYFAGVLPEDKYTKIRELQTKNNTVLMVGDGINDAPALTQADVGIAIGAGTDVAVESGDVVLTNNDPKDVAKLVKLSKKVYVKMIQNLFWALGYNVIAIPAAAGVFAYWGFFLRPEVGALVMSLSTVIVVANALTLRKINLQ